MFRRRAANKGSDTRLRVSIVVVILLGIHGPASVPDATAADQYAALVSQLTGLVAQRSDLVAELVTADSVAGKLALRDFLATVRSPLGAQTQQATDFAALLPMDQSPQATDLPSFYRASAPGTLLGPHVPRSRLAQPSTSAPVGHTVLSAPIVSAPQLPPRYQSLGVAGATWPNHAVDISERAVSLSDLAVQARSLPSTVAVVVAPHWYTPTLLTGAAAAHAYSSLVNVVFPQVLAAVSPASVATGTLTKNSRPTSVAGLNDLLGHYVVNRAAGVAGSGTGRRLGSAVWSLSATRPLSDGTTLQVQSGGAVTFGALRAVSYSVFTTRTPTSVLPATPLQLSLDLHVDGSAAITATEVLSNSTAVQMAVRIPNLLADPAIASAVGSEQEPLHRLTDVLTEGNLAYAQVSPLYNARASAYEQSFSLAMKQNAVLEEAWWNQTQRWNRYQTALAKWQQRDTLWKQYLASKTPIHKTAVSLTPAVGRPTATAVLTATVTPQARGIGIPWPGAFTTGAAMSKSAALGVGGGPVEHEVALAGRTPIFADTPVQPSPVTGGGVTSVTSTVTAGPTSTAVESATTALSTATVVATPTSTATPSPVKTDTQIATPTATPSPTATLSPTATPSPTASVSPTATASEEPSLFTQGSAPSPVITPQATFDAGASATVATATPTVTFAPSETDTFTPSETATASASDTPSRTASPVRSATRTKRTDTPSATASPSATLTASSTPSMSPTTARTASPEQTATMTASRTATVTATEPIDAPPTPHPTATALAGGASALLPPGPPPAVVRAPAAQPPYVALPVPLAPLPAWVDAPIDVTPAEEQLYEAYGVNAKGYADMTSSQLIAGGALDNVSGFLPPIQGVITTFWGGSTPWQSFHPGIDIAGPDGTPVHAAADGIVVYAGLAVLGDPTQSYGNCVVIEHNGHLSTLYGHMQIGLHGLQVQVGQVVRQGQVIGYEGQTGFATGPHVHFEMRLDNVEFDPLLLVNENLITGQ